MNDCALSFATSPPLFPFASSLEKSRLPCATHYLCVCVLVQARAMHAVYFRGMANLNQRHTPSSAVPFFMSHPTPVNDSGPSNSAGMNALASAFTRPTVVCMCCGMRAHPCKKCVRVLMLCIAHFEGGEEEVVMVMWGGG